MTRVTDLLKQLSSPSPTDDETDLVLGLPLENNGRTIYPVFADPGPSNDPEAEPRRIGYLELSEDRSDYTSLESDNRPIALIPVLLVLVFVVFWLLRRSRSNK
jgi:hypothetical protein